MEILDDNIKNNLSGGAVLWFKCKDERKYFEVFGIGGVEGKWQRANSLKDAVEIERKNNASEVEKLGEVKVIKMEYGKPEEEFLVYI